MNGRRPGSRVAPYAAIAPLARMGGRCLRSSLLWIAIVAVAATVASADSHGPRGRGHGPPSMERLLAEEGDRLGLDPEVRAKIVAISKARQAEGKKSRDAAEEARRTLREAVRAEALDEARIMALADEIGALEVAAHKSRLRGMLETRALLTPEQRATLDEIRDERRARHRERRRHGRPDGAGGRKGGPPSRQP